MERHATDWTSGIAGAMFAVIGGGFLIGNLDWASLETTAFWAFGVIALGVLVAGSALVRIVSDANRRLTD